MSTPYSGSENQPLVRNIRTIVRIRPSLKLEDHGSCIEINDSQTISLIKADEGKSSSSFKFDKVLNPDCTQEEIYASVSDLVKDSVEGYNCAIYAYGVSAAGKTHTMVGNSSSPGIINRGITDLFRQVKNISLDETKQKVYYIEMSYIELYNNNFVNLLHNAGNSSHNLSSASLKSKSTHGIIEASEKIAIHDSSVLGVFLSGSKDIRLPINSSSTAQALFAYGERNRTNRATKSNKKGSRGHAVLTFYIECRDFSNGDLVLSKMQFVDLASAENLAGSKAVTDKLIKDETHNINLSLTALGDVLLHLNSHDSEMHPEQYKSISVAKAASSKAKSFHIPYKNSRLTHYLRESLVGNCRSAFITCLRPELQFYQPVSTALQYTLWAGGVHTKSSLIQFKIGTKWSKEVDPEVERLKKLIDQRTNEMENSKDVQRLSFTRDEGDEVEIVTSIKDVDEIVLEDFSKEIIEVDSNVKFPDLYDVNDLLATIQSLEDSNHALTNENSALRSSLDDEITTHENLLKWNEALVKVNDELLKAQKDQQKIDQQKMDISQIKYETLENENKSLKDKIGELEKIIKQKENENSILQSNLDISTEECVRLKALLNEQLKSTKSHGETVEKDNNNLKEQLLIAHDKIDALTQEKDKALRNCEAIDDKLQATLKLNEELSKVKDETLLMKADREEQLERLEDIFNAAVLKNSSLSEQLNGAIDELESSGNDLELANKKIEELSLKLAAAIEQLRLLSNEYEKKESEVKAKDELSEELANRLNFSQNENTTLNKKLDDALRNLDDISRSRATLVQDSIELKRSSKEQSKLIDELKSEL
eukprot:gene4911-6874_t